MKTEFELESVNKGRDNPDRICGKIMIIGEAPENPPYVSMELYNGSGYAWIKDKDLERFAVNILKALKSKKLKIK